MDSRFGLPIFGILVLSACAPHSSIKNGAVALEEQVDSRAAPDADTATREIAAVEATSFSSCQVEENLTDVRRTELDGGAEFDRGREFPGRRGNRDCDAERSQGCPRRITLTGPQTAGEPGSGSPARDSVLPGCASRREVRRAARGIRGLVGRNECRHRPMRFASRGLADLDRAIANLEGPQGDAQLAAEAHLVKAGITALSSRSIFTRRWWRRGVRSRLSRSSARRRDCRPRAHSLIEAQALSEIAQDHRVEGPDHRKPTRRHETLADTD